MRCSYSQSTAVKCACPLKGTWNFPAAVHDPDLTQQTSGTGWSVRCLGQTKSFAFGWEEVPIPRWCSQLFQPTLTHSPSLPQFEYVSQHLVFANCIPLILKFFNQNIMSYIAAKNRYSPWWGTDR